MFKVRLIMANRLHPPTHDWSTGQNTVTAHYAEKGWSCTKAHEKYRPTPRIHYRMVTKEAGYPMSYIRGSYEVFTSTLCIVQGLLFDLIFEQC